MTLPTLLYANKLERLSDEWRRLHEVVGGFAATDEDVNAVIKAIRTSGAIDESIQVAETFAGRAKAALAATPPSQTRDLLSAMADLAVNRTS